MKDLKTILHDVRVYLGWGALAETRLSPDHGWLLNKPSSPPRGDPARDESSTK